MNNSPRYDLEVLNAVNWNTNVGKAGYVLSSNMNGARER